MSARSRGRLAVARVVHDQRLQQHDAVGAQLLPAGHGRRISADHLLVGRACGEISSQWYVYEVPAPRATWGQISYRARTRSSVRAAIEVPSFLYLLDGGWRRVTQPK